MNAWWYSHMLEYYAAEKRGKHTTNPLTGKILKTRRRVKENVVVGFHASDTNPGNTNLRSCNGDRNSWWGWGMQSLGREVSHALFLIWQLVP